MRINDNSKIIFSYLKSEEGEKHVAADGVDDVKLRAG